MNRRKSGTLRAFWRSASMMFRLQRAERPGQAARGAGQAQQPVQRADDGAVVDVRRPEVGQDQHGGADAITTTRFRTNRASGRPCASRSHGLTS